MKNRLILISLLILSACSSKQSINSSFNISNEINVNLSNTNLLSMNSSSLSSTITSSSYLYEPIKYINIEPNPIEKDIYKGINHSDFYSSYSEAISYEDALLRTKYGFISGSINYNDNLHESNTIYSGENFVKFGNYIYGVNSNNEIISYNINYINGTYKTIYKGAGYVTVEEVAAYILAFGEVPPNNNYDKKKGQNESISKWWKYGRVNVGKYSNDVEKYPEEPELPTKDSTGKLYQYTETDIGLDNYNDGFKISRGTYRICFTSSYKDGSKILDVRERYVFFTANHYLDFEEYLNYYGGWSDMFGYYTGNRVSPTPYVEAIITDKNTL